MQFDKMIGIALCIFETANLSTAMDKHPLTHTTAKRRGSIVELSPGLQSLECVVNIIASDKSQGEKIKLVREMTTDYFFPIISSSDLTKLIENIVLLYYTNKKAPLYANALRDYRIFFPRIRSKRLRNWAYEQLANIYYDEIAALNSREEDYQREHFEKSKECEQLNAQLRSYSETGLKRKSFSPEMIQSMADEQFALSQKIQELNKSSREIEEHIKQINERRNCIDKTMMTDFYPFFFDRQGNPTFAFLNFFCLEHIRDSEYWMQQTRLRLVGSMVRILQNEFKKTNKINESTISKAYNLLRGLIAHGDPLRPAAFELKGASFHASIMYYNAILQQMKFDVQIRPLLRSSAGKQHVFRSIRVSKERTIQHWLALYNYYYKCPHGLKERVFHYLRPFEKANALKYLLGAATYVYLPNSPYPIRTQDALTNVRPLRDINSFKKLISDVPSLPIQKDLFDQLRILTMNYRVQDESSENDADSSSTESTELVDSEDTEVVDSEDYDSNPLM